MDRFKKNLTAELAENAELKSAKAGKDFLSVLPFPA
jgi:hypothetical protein